MSPPGSGTTGVHVAASAGTEAYSGSTPVFSCSAASMREGMAKGDEASQWVTYRRSSFAGSPAGSVDSPSVLSGVMVRFAYEAGPCSLMEPSANPPTKAPIARDGDADPLTKTFIRPSETTSLMWFQSSCLMGACVWY